MSRFASALAVALLALTTASCSGGDSPATKPTSQPSSSQTTEAAAPPPVPSRTACYRLTVAQLTEPTNDSHAVACTRRHSAQTIFVGRLSLVRDGHAIRVDSPHVQAQVARTCPRRLAAYLGGEAQDRDLSRFRVAWFSPTLEEADAGARWFRCDLVVFGAGDVLHPERGRVPSGVLATAVGMARYSLCGTAAPGAAGFQRVLCSMSHSWRAISTISLEGGRRYPGEAAARAGGDSACKDAVRAAQNFALKFTYGWEWPTRAQWRAGQHYGYCWAPD